MHDAGELVDNVADSADESEDEWNYFKGDEANKDSANTSEPDAEVIKHVLTFSNILKGLHFAGCCYYWTGGFRSR